MKDRLTSRKFILAVASLALFSALLVGKYIDQTTYTGLVCVFCGGLIGMQLAGKFKGVEP